MRNYDQYSGRDYCVRVARDGCHCGLSVLGFVIEPGIIGYRCLQHHCLRFVIEIGPALMVIEQQAE